MGVDVDAARQDEQPGRVDDLAGARREPAEVGLDRLDRLAANGDVRPPRARRRDHGPAADQQVRSDVRDRHPARIPAPR